MEHLGLFKTIVVVTVGKKHSIKIVSSSTSRVPGIWMIADGFSHSIPMTF